MDFGNGIEANLTEKLMAAINPYIKPSMYPQEHYNYNRCFEAIYEILCNERLKQ